MRLEIKDLHKQFGNLKVLDGIHLPMRQESVNVLLGPSGCGKTTLLHILAGLDKDYRGDLGDIARCSISYVFQEDRLLPWLSAIDNVCFALESTMGRSEAKRQAHRALEAVGLSGSEEAYPMTLSGGMRRRVALARAFAYPAELILLDEPFSSLDLKTRISVMDTFLDLRREYKRTALLVTHDVREAIYLGDSISTLTEKPARISRNFSVQLERESRSYASSDSAALEAQLYACVLASGDTGGK